MSSQICKFLSWNLCEIEEGINITELMLTLQIRNIYLIDFFQHAISMCLHKSHLMGCPLKRNVVSIWAWCWAHVRFIIDRCLSSTSKESMGYALRSKLGWLYSLSYYVCYTCVGSFTGHAWWVTIIFWINHIAFTWE